ncbi:hypothetical protein ACLBWX_22895 [Methylobacterium sp. M6A4_1b]
MLGGILVRDGHLCPLVAAHGLGEADPVAIAEQEGCRGRIRHEGVDRGDDVRLDDGLRLVEIAGGLSRISHAGEIGRCAAASASHPGDEGVDRHARHHHAAQDGRNAHQEVSMRALLVIGLFGR